MSNKSMGPLSERGLYLGLKVAASVLSVCVALGLGWMLWQRFPGHKITDQELLREAVAEWKGAGESGSGPSYQIFEQQAAQGYYDDAADTAHLFKSTEDLNWSMVELTKIRSENGDIQGAKNSLHNLDGSDVRAKATRVIALIQAYRGDLAGALETIAPIGQSDEVLLAFGQYQVEHGDFEGALNTAARTKSGYQLYYDIGDALRLRAEQSRAPKLAAQMKDPKLAALFLECARFTLSFRKEEVITIQATPCDDSWLYATQGKFSEADAVILKNKCPNVSFVAARQYAADPSGAEKLLRANADKDDLARGLGEFVKAAAEKGNITEALRFLGDVQSLGPGRVSSQVQEIARSWTIRDGPRAVLQWARSRPTPEQRTWALLGMAEALGHPTSRRYPL